MDQQNHFFSLIAVFLSLGIGILIGASMGENALVHNQINVIESLRSEIVRYKDEVNTYFSSLTLLKEELLRWESLEEEYLSPLLLENKLENYNVKVIVQEEMPEELLDFLELTGAFYLIYTFDKNFFEQGSVLWKEFVEDELNLIDEAELYNILGNELNQSTEGYRETASGNLLDILREKELLQVITSEDLADGESAELRKYESELFIVVNSPAPLLEHLVEKIGEDKMIIWKDFAANIDKTSSIDNTNDTEDDLVSFSMHRAKTFYSRLRLLELINNTSCCAAQATKLQFA